MILFYFFTAITLIWSTQSKVILQAKDSEFPIIPTQKKAYSLSFDLIIYGDYVVKGSEQNRTVLYLSSTVNNEIRCPEVSLLADNKLQVCSSPVNTKSFCYHGNTPLPYGKTIKIKIEQVVKLNDEFNFIINIDNHIVYDQEVQTVSEFFWNEQGQFWLHEGIRRFHNVQIFKGRQRKMDSFWNQSPGLFASNVHFENLPEHFKVQKEYFFQTIPTQRPYKLFFAIMLLKSDDSLITVKDTNVFSLVASQINTNGSKRSIITDQVTLVAGQPKLRICTAGSSDGREQICFTTGPLPHGKFINFRVKKDYTSSGSKDTATYSYTLRMSEDVLNPGEPIFSTMVRHQYDDVDVIFGHRLEPANVYVRNFYPIIMQDNGNWFVL
ncbi:uncharacterized protein [Clytia hemisphaerica]|uniref:Uncharacterized protein n=1 Tax=Clytia hemisphaerica TaxID=252671 RepID=A0A7M5XHE4_9CNID